MQQKINVKDAPIKKVKVRPKKKYVTEKKAYDYDDLSYRTFGVIGLGYVGLPLAVAIAEKGYTVVGYDIDKQKIKRLEERDAPYLKQEEQEVFKESTFTITSHFEDIQNADIFFICVPTPVNEDHTPDLGPLIDATRTVAAALRPGNLVLVESSVNPSVCDDVIIPILEFESDLMVERDFYVAHCPERVNPGDERYNVKNIPRILGAAGPHSLERGRKVYESILDTTIFPVANLKEAEAVKMVENSFRDLNIAFVNELAMAFAREGIDVMNVINAAATKPFGFMAHYPSCGVGGHCIPVDPYYLIHYGFKHGFTHNLLIAARETNNYMPHYTLRILREAFHHKELNVHDTPVTLLGLAYKKGISDVRESPALVMYDLLRQDGVSVQAYDPYVPELSTVGTLEEALRGSKAVIIATDHPEFSSLEPSYFESIGVEVIIDGKNMLNKESFLTSPVSYYGIGR